MATIFDDGDPVTKEWLNKVSKTATDAAGDSTSPGELRVFIDAERAGTASAVNDDLAQHKANTSIHFDDAPNDTKDYVRGQGAWKSTALTEAPVDGEIYGRRDGSWTVTGGAGTVTDHQTLANRSAIDAHPKSAITGLDQDITNLDAHRANILNPHQVTALQVGADPVGSASTVQSNLDTHTADSANPHAVTAAQAGADPVGSASTVQGNLTTHEADATNPHTVTAIQVGADPTGSAATVQSDLDAHKATTHLGDSPVDGQYYGRKDAGWAIIPGTGTGVDPSDHSQLLNRDAADSHPISSITYLYGKVIGYDEHIISEANPHSVTAAQAGADAAGSASAVQGNLNTHTSNLTNPHNVTAAQVGADVSGSASAVQGNLDTHTANVTNPHSVTATQVNADPAGSSAAVQSNLDSHKNDTAAHIGHATSDTNQYVSKDGSWQLLSVTAPPVETDHTKFTNRNQPNQHGIASIGVLNGTQLLDEIDRIDAAVASKANQDALVAHGGDTTIHYADAPSNGLEYVRKNAGWVVPAASGNGDLKADGSVQMSGSYTPVLGQDIATKTSSEAVFTDRLAGYSVNGKHEDYTGDLNDIDHNVTYGVTTSNGNYPSATNNGFVTTRVSAGGGRRQYVELRGADNWNHMYARVFVSGAWRLWHDLLESQYSTYNNVESGLSSTTVQSALDEINAGKADIEHYHKTYKIDHNDITSRAIGYQHTADNVSIGAIATATESVQGKIDGYDDSLVDSTHNVQYRLRNKTQADYDYLINTGTDRDDTIYFIVG